VALAEPGNRVIVTAGVPFDVAGTTNLLKVEDGHVSGACRARRPAATAGETGGHHGVRAAAR
jgi:hypothetical protein